MVLSPISCTKASNRFTHPLHILSQTPEFPQCILERSSIGRKRFVHRSIARDVVHSILLRRRYRLLGQDSLHLDGIDAGHIALKALPSSNPALARVANGDEALEDLARTVGDAFGVAAELEELFAVGAAEVGELLRRLYDGADHAGAHVAVLAGGDEVVCVRRHVGGGFDGGHVGRWKLRLRGLILLRVGSC